MSNPAPSLATKGAAPTAFPTPALAKPIVVGMTLPAFSPTAPNMLPTLPATEPAPRPTPPAVEKKFPLSLVAGPLALIIFLDMPKLNCLPNLVPPNFAPKPLMPSIPLFTPPNIPLRSESADNADKEVKASIAILAALPSAVISPVVLSTPIPNEFIATSRASKPAKALPPAPPPPNSPSAISSISDFVVFPFAYLGI